MFFVFSGGGPVFQQRGRAIHLDLAVKYSQGHIPRSLEPVSAEVVPYATLYGSPEYVGIPANYPGRTISTAHQWTQPLEKVRPACRKNGGVAGRDETMKRTAAALLHRLAALWWRLGKVCGFHERVFACIGSGSSTFSSLLRWSGWVTWRTIGFPGTRIFTARGSGAAGLHPAKRFYSIPNDVLSPLAFGAAFICWCGCCAAEIRASGSEHSPVWRWRDVPDQISNRAPPGRVRLVVLFKLDVWPGQANCAPPTHRWRALVLCAVLADDCLAGVGKHTFGDFTGTAAKNFNFSTGRPNRSANGGSIRFSRRTVYGPLCRASWQRSGREGISLASPAAGVAGCGRITQFNPSVSSEWPSCPAFPFHGLRSQHSGRRFGSAFGVSLRRWCFWGSCPSLRFSRLLLSVGRPPVFHVGPVDARRVDSIFRCSTFTDSTAR